MKYKLILIFAMSFLLNEVATSQTCDCDIFPVKPECKKTCGIKLLQSGSKEQLKKTLNIEDKTAEKIISSPDRKNMSKIEDFKEVLPYNYYTDLENKFNVWIKNTTIIQKTTTGDNVGGDKIVNVYGSDSKGGLISKPKTPADFYHNARLYGMGGDIKKAKESYLKYFESNQDFIDPHIFYQELLKNTDGIEEVKRVYKDFLDRNPNSIMYQYLQARLLDRNSRIEKCKILYMADSSYMPVVYQLAFDYLAENSTDYTTNTKLLRLKYLKRFETLNENNYFLKYYLDKKEAIDIIELMKSRLNTSKTYDSLIYNNPVSIYVTNSDLGNGSTKTSLSFAITELCNKIWYKMDSDSVFIFTGISDMVNTYNNNQKMPNYLVELYNLSSGNHKCFVKYENTNQEIMGPFECAVNVETILQVKLQTFRNVLKLAYDSGIEIQQENKKELKLSASWCAGSEDVFDTISLKVNDLDNEFILFLNGTNITAKDKWEGSDKYAGSFFLKGISAGNHTFILSFKLKDKSIQKIKFDVNVIADDKPYTYLGTKIE